MLANAGIIDHTKQTKTSLKVLRNTARNHVIILDTKTLIFIILLKIFLPIMTVKLS